jgi:EmrB/QacA subfamily drug resistance transporter
VIEGVPPPTTDQPDAVEVAAPLTHKPYVALFVVCFGLVIVVLDNTILNIALPALSRDLGASTSDLQWIVDSYTLTYACLMLTAGSLGDRFGRRRSLFWGVAFFGLTSAIASFATSSTLLIAARALMGVAAAFMTPASLSIVTNLFHESRERTRAIGMWAAVSSVGAAAGPVLGGILLAHYWWGSVFLVNVPISIVLVIALPIFVPETRDPHPNKVDPLGAALSIVALSAVLWATIAGPDRGWGSAPILSGYAIGIAALVAFIWWERTTDNPLLDLRFFRIPAFSAATAANAAMVMAWSGSAFMFVQLLQSVLGFSPLQAGLRVVPTAIIGACGSIAGVPLTLRYGRKRVIVFGLSLEAVGALLFLNFALSQGYAGAITYFLIFSAGQALVFSPCIASAMDSVPREKAGSASGANNTIRQVSLAFGVAITGSVMSSTYRDGLATRVSDSGLDAATIDKARKSIASAVQTAGELPQESGRRLLSAAKDAFVPAVHSSMLVAAVICVLGTVATIVWLPKDSGGLAIPVLHDGL